MYWKRRGEQEFIRLCKNSRTRSPSSSSSSSSSSSKPSYYTVIRAGGATGEKGFGMQNVTLRQGDYIRGSLPMEDLASVTVASLYTKETRDTVFEVVLLATPLFINLYDCYFECSIFSIHTMIYIIL